MQKLYSDHFIPCSKALLEKLTVGQEVKKLSNFYGTQRFITIFERDKKHQISTRYTRPGEWHTQMGMEKQQYNVRKRTYSQNTKIDNNDNIHQ
jgi:hypothetical protein